MPSANAFLLKAFVPAPLTDLWLAVVAVLDPIAYFSLYADAFVPEIQPPALRTERKLIVDPGRMGY
jgi:hypothetical protein